MRSSSPEAWTATSAPADLTFWTTPIGSLTAAQHMRIDPDGAVLIATETGWPTATSNKLQVLGPARFYREDTFAQVHFGRYATTFPVAGGSEVARLNFGINDVTDSSRSVAQIRAITETEYDGTVATYPPTTLAFQTNAGGGSAPTERMRINSLGLVGIGTTSISAQLTVKNLVSDFGAAITLRSTDAASNWARLDLHNANAVGPFFLYQDNGGGGAIRTDNTNEHITIHTIGDAQLIFRTFNVERMRIKATGVINMPGMPTSSAGLSSGDLWNNGGVVNIV